MCGIAGLFDLSGEGRRVPDGMLGAMAASMIHRGPDEDGFLDEPGIGLASRRLSIVGLSDGRQPIHNEDRSISVVFNGELFDYPEVRARLEAHGHQFRTHCDTEIIPHLWEQHGDELFGHLRGQFAFALWDRRQRRLLLARDQFGVCPLYFTVQRIDGGDWLLFASEVKSLLATGMVDAVPDRRGIHQMFTFFALPGRVTCFQGVELLPPGRCLEVRLDGSEAGRVKERTYFEIDFPERGQEQRGGDPVKLVDQFQELLLNAVEKRLRADVPVVSYLSGGIDSSIVVALANHIRKEPIPTFTVKVEDPQLDETREAGLVARHVGSKPVVVRYSTAEALGVYPRLIRAAEAPVVDTSCGALLLLAQEVNRQGYKVALTGEGADEWFGSYPWYNTHAILSKFDAIPGLPISMLVRQLAGRMLGMPTPSRAHIRRVYDSVGGSNAWLEIYGLMGTNKLRFFSAEMVESLQDHIPFNDIGLNLPRMAQWHPFHRSLLIGARVQLPGLLLNGKGDRVAMHNSVETRYPFLDLEVYQFLAKLHPHWKRYLFRDKYLLRKLCARWLPKSIAWRRKAMFRAPFNLCNFAAAPPFV
ncbi:MAG: asparagine synthase (glutamine-hydrolyzing), partial [Gemmataceae bacterium]